MMDDYEHKRIKPIHINVILKPSFNLMKILNFLLCGVLSNVARIIIIYPSTLRLRRLVVVESMKNQKRL